MDAAERKRTIQLLDELAGAVEEMLLSGLTSASASTRERIGVGFQEAGRQKLLRLAGTLRIVMEELRRFDADPGSLAADRLAFFLDRAWLLSRAMAEALRTGDEAAWARLSRTPASEPLPSVRALVVGAFKRHVPGAFTAFELRLRALGAAGPLAAGASMSLSFVFPAKPGVKIAPETFLHLEQPQKFRPIDLLAGGAITIEGAALSTDAPMRLMLGPKSRVSVGDVAAWEPVVAWDRARASERVREERPDPLALPIELQEEAVVRDWSLGEFRDVGRPYQVAELRGDHLAFEVRAEAALVRERLGAASLRAVKPIVFGLLHYELCRMVLTPLGLLTVGEPPELLQLELTKIDKAELVKAMQIR